MRVWAAIVCCLLAVPAAAQNVVIATTGTFPPYLWQEGEVRGFDVDLMDAICERNGYLCEYRVLPLGPGLEAVASGAADVALGGIGITPEREAFGDFTCPYQPGGAGSAPVFALDRSIDIATARIAVLGDSLFHRNLTEQGLNAVPFDDLMSAITSVLTGETDAFHGNAGNLSLVESARARLVEIGAVAGRGSGGVGFLVTASRPRLLADLNDSLASLHRDGRLQEIAGRWFAPGDFVAPADMGLACGILVTAR